MNIYCFISQQYTAGKYGKSKIKAFNKEFFEKQQVKDTVRKLYQN